MINEIDPPSAYSCFFEIQLDKEDLGKSRSQHFRICNLKLKEHLIQLDIENRQLCETVSNSVILEDLNLKNYTQVHGNFVWEHCSKNTANNRIGVMRLVPASQHNSKSKFWRTIHPGFKNRGGYHEWAEPHGAPAGVKMPSHELKGLKNSEIPKLSKEQLPNYLYKAVLTNNYSLLKRIEHRAQIILSKTELQILFEKPYGKHSNSLLHIAVRSGHIPTIELILKNARGNQILNHQNIKGETPLHIAAEHNRKVVIKKLSQLGSNHQLKNINGETVYHILENEKKNFSPLSSPLSSPRQSPFSHDSTRVATITLKKEVLPPPQTKRAQLVPPTLSRKQSIFFTPPPAPPMLKLKVNDEQLVPKLKLGESTTNQANKKAEKQEFKSFINPPLIEKKISSIKDKNKIVPPINRLQQIRDQLQKEQKIRTTELSTKKSKLKPTQQQTIEPRAQQLLSRKNRNHEIHIQPKHQEQLLYQQRDKRLQAQLQRQQQKDLQQRAQHQRDQQMRAQHQRDQQMRAQHQRDQQMRAQQQRDQQMRAQQQRDQQMRAQQLREQRRTQQLHAQHKRNQYLQQQRQQQCQQRNRSVRTLIIQQQHIQQRTHQLREQRRTQQLHAQQQRNQYLQQQRQQQSQQRNRHTRTMIHQQQHIKQLRFQHAQRQQRSQQQRMQYSLQIQQRNQQMRAQQQRDQQMRAQQQRDQQMRAQQQRDQQMRAQQQRDQQMRAQQQRDQQMRAQQQRDQQMRAQQQRDQQMRAQQQRDQQMRAQQQRDQQMRAQQQARATQQAAAAARAAANARAAQQNAINAAAQRAWQQFSTRVNQINRRFGK